MRITATLITLTFIFLACLPKQEFIEIHKKYTPVKIRKIIPQPTINIDTNKLVTINQLIPIDTINSKSKNVYKKYGLEFYGNCYACDLAKFSITKKIIKLTNVCDENPNQVFTIIEITNTDNRIEIKTKEYDFILTEIDKAPVYELKIIGNYIESKNLRISKYYTLKKILKKFEEHDCGDFQG